MAELPETNPEFPSNIADLGGDLRHRSHFILRNGFVEGQEQFSNLVQQEREAAQEHYETECVQILKTIEAKSIAAGQKRDLFFAAQHRFEFHRFGGDPVGAEIPVRITAMARGQEDDAFIASTHFGALHISIREPIGIKEGENRNPAQDVYHSLSNGWPTASGLLLFDGNQLIHWGEVNGQGMADFTVFESDFDTQVDPVRQSIDIDNQRLAFAVGHDLCVMDLRPFLQSQLDWEGTIMLQRRLAHPAGGLALLENAGGPYVFATDPVTGSIYLHTGTSHFGITVDGKTDSKIKLLAPLVDGQHFTLEFAYCFPQTLPPRVQMPLVGAMGYPCFYLDTHTLAFRFEWHFPDYPSLQSIAFSLEGKWDRVPGEWVHLAVTKENDVLTIYENGFVASTQVLPQPTPLPAGDLPMYLGNFTGHDFPANYIGTFAELRTWNRSRSETEIREGHRGWIMASENGFPEDLIMYHRFWGPGTFWTSLEAGLDQLPSVTDARDLARPSERFNIAKPKTMGLKPASYFEAELLFWKTSRPLADWVAVDPGGGVVCWGEKFEDDWYLMQAPASGHLSPQKVRKIEEWEVGLVVTPELLAGDILSMAAQEQLALLRHGLQCQQRALGIASVKVMHAYQQLFEALDRAASHDDANTNLQEHRDAHDGWIESHNEDLASILKHQVAQHEESSNALREALSIIRQAEEDAIAIRRKAQLARMRRIR
jgi:hypothetical protein